jgi:two-component sensor histidine kinase
MTSVPVAGEEKPGVLFASLDLNWLQRRLEQSDIPAGAAVTIADRNGVIIARNPLPERFVGTRIPEALMHLVNAPKPGTLELTSQDGTVRILSYAPVSIEPVGLYVSSGLSKDEAFRAINHSTAIALLATVLSTSLAVGLALALGWRFIERPVAGILSAIERWRAGDRKARSQLRADAGELGTIGGALDGLLDELGRRDRERDLLGREIAHRVKNTLAIVQAIAHQTIRGGPDGFSTFSMRLNALGRAYDVLLAGEWQSSTLEKVVESATAAHQDTSRRITFQGQNVSLSARAVLALTLVLHELCTNAIKYGALSAANGKVAITSSLHEDHRIVLTWRETGGPFIPEMPRTTGFGTVLIGSAFPAELEASVESNFRPEGLICVVAFRAEPRQAAS